MEDIILCPLIPLKTRAPLLMMLIAITAYASDYGVICLKHTVTYFLFLVNHHHSQVNNNPAQRLQTILSVYLSLRNSQKLIFQFGVTRNVVTFIDPIEIVNREEERW